MLSEPLEAAAKAWFKHRGDCGDWDALTETEREEWYPYARAAIEAAVDALDDLQCRDVTDAAYNSALPYGNSEDAAKGFRLTLKRALLREEPE